MSIPFPHREDEVSTSSNSKALHSSPNIYKLPNISYRHEPGSMGKTFPAPSQLSTPTTIAAAPISRKTTIHHQPPKRDGSSPPPGPDFASLLTGLLGRVSSRETEDSEPQPGQALTPQCTIRPHFGHSETAILTSCTSLAIKSTSVYLSYW